MKSLQKLAWAAIIVGLYGLTPLPWSGWVASLGAIIVGVLILTR